MRMFAFNFIFLLLIFSLIYRYTVDDLVIPEIFYDDIDNVRIAVDGISVQIDDEVHNHLSVFIDPIDGTREFSTSTCVLLLLLYDIYNKILV